MEEIFLHYCYQAEMSSNPIHGQHLLKQFSTEDTCTLWAIWLGLLTQIPLI